MLSQSFLYEFFTNRLPDSYGQTCLIGDGFLFSLVNLHTWKTSQVLGSLVQRLPARRGGCVPDLIFIVVTIAFFVLSLAYVSFCDRIR